MTLLSLLSLLVLVVYWGGFAFFAGAFAVLETRKTVRAIAMALIWPLVVYDYYRLRRRGAGQSRGEVA